MATILRGVYQIALSYGFSYETTNERIYILRLIRVSLSSGDMKKIDNNQLDSLNYDNTRLDEEIEQTAKVFSDKLLVEKFVQEIPLIGVVGAIVNNIIYRKITKLSIIKYKKRYLHQKRP